jgi:hippurate hydrolase
MSLLDDAAGLREDLVALRRELHQIPEVGLHLPRTQQRVLAALADLPLEVTTGSALSSVTAVLRGAHPGPAVLLRADMDALPITERTGLPYSSHREGAMHACGHDLHTAGVMGAAWLLAARRDELAGDVVFMFQPGEEGLDGAEHMIREGVLDAAGRPLAAAYGLHVFSAQFPTGHFASRPGPLMASADGLFVRVVGSGGHGGRPHHALDPVPVACEMIIALQTMVTRRFDVFDPVVITVGAVTAGSARSIIPDSATFEATVRAFSETARRGVQEAAIRVCQGIASAHGLRAEVDYVAEYPVTVNDEVEHAFLAQTVGDLFGAQRFQRLDSPVLASEDFSRVLAAVPGAYVFLGACVNDQPSSAAYNHSPQAAFDDSVLVDAAALLAELATRRLARRD